MSERPDTALLIEAITAIEAKQHEVHWYDDEAHGWDGRENRRDAYKRTLAFLRRHVLGETVDAPGPTD